MKIKENSCKMLIHSRYWINSSSYLLSSFPLGHIVISEDNPSFILWFTGNNLTPAHLLRLSLTSPRGQGFPNPTPSPGKYLFSLCFLNARFIQQLCGVVIAIPRGLDDAEASRGAWARNLRRPSQVCASPLWVLVLITATVLTRKPRFREMKCLAGR